MQKGIIAISAFLFFFGLVKRTGGEKKEGKAEQGSFKQQGLGLEVTVTKVIRKKEKENYHLESMNCDDCHGYRPDITKEKRDKIRLVEENIIILCNKCHEGDNLHPVGVIPDLDKTGIRVPEYLPLGIKGDNKNRIICTTCHAVHINDASNYLLRGFLPSNKDREESILESERASFFQERSELCEACHTKAFLELNPHNRRTKSCKFCHIETPEGEINIEETFNKDIVKLCNFCHNKTRDAHYLAVNPFYDNELKKEISKYKIVLINGKTVCVSCHDPHGGSKLSHYLRENYVTLAERSKRINPHWIGTFCLSCHENKSDNNKETRELGFKFERDYNKICNWCHETKEARQNIHPVNMVPQKRVNLRITREFPLQEGRLTCVSCHDVRKQEKYDKEQKKLDPNFLIGGPYKDKNEMCFRCHIQKKFSEINAHDQITDEGEIKNENCIYCHTSRPDREVEGLENIDPTIEDLSYLCTRCHENINHPAKRKHLVKMSKEKYRRKLHYESLNNVFYPLDARNYIFCGTCHSVHESGIVKSTKASKGSDMSQRVRLPLTKGELCLVCHDKDSQTVEDIKKNDEDDF
ncbi:MAG: hypothetical protein HY934_00305 [Candidatus Firestonebacteria bacterium]|nr:hypothetical protein [Candidatus Firestonebacteria bacterium]